MIEVCGEGSKSPSRNDDEESLTTKSPHGMNSRTNLEIKRPKAYDIA